jgi:GDPmannose 4,6-dehydratase
MPTALITGITGQDGSYLAELLIANGYEVYGLIRRASTFNTGRIDHIYHDPHGNGNNVKLHLHYGDVSAPDTLLDIIYNARPTEIYHLAAQSHVRVSFDMAEYTGDITGLGTVRILDAIRKSGITTRFYQASSSEMFGSAKPPQNEDTPFEPRSPYAAAKVYAYWMARNFREGYKLFTCNGILFNHESPRRGETFVTRKITRAAAAIKGGKQSYLYLGNLDARRDWGYAPEYVEVMWKMLQLEQPGDYVVGTGEAHTIREFLDEAFGYIGLDWHDYVKIDPRYFRPTEVDFLMADPSRARKALNWEPKIRFHELVRIMMDADMELVGLPSPGEGQKLLLEKFADWHRWEHQVVSMDK